MHKEIIIQPGDKLTITTTTVDGATIVQWLGEQFYPLLDSEQDRIYTVALSRMIGISDVEAVRRANRYAKDKGWPERASVGQFRKWLPAMLSKLFAQEIR